MQTETTTVKKTTRKKPTKQKPSPEEIDELLEGELDDELDDGDLEFSPPPSVSTRKMNVFEKRQEVERQIDLNEWLSSFGEQGSQFEVKLYRTEPEKHKGVKTNGFLKNTNQSITEEKIEEEYGGGIYKVQLHYPDPRHNGKSVFAGHKLIEIPGPPKIDQYVEGGGRSTEDPTVAGEALSMIKEIALRGGDNSNTELILAVLQMMQESSRTSTKEKDAIQTKMLELMTQPRDDGATTQLLNQVINQESKRVEQLQENHRHEIQMLRAGYEQDLKRLEDKNQRDLDFLRQQHQSTLDDIKRSRDNEVMMLKMSKESELGSITRSNKIESDVLRRENDRLSAEIAKLETKIVVLEGKKDQTILDKANEVMGLMGQMQELGLGKTEEEQKGKLDRIIDAFVENPQLLQRLAGGGAPPPEAATQQQLSPQLKQTGKPFTAPDGVIYVPMEDAEGNTYLRDPQGVPHLLSDEDAESFKKHREAVVEEEKADEQLMMAADYLEGAMNAGTDPVTLASSVGAVIPPATRDRLVAEGADDLIEKVVKHKPASRLKTQAGRAYVRKVIESL